METGPELFPGTSKVDTLLVIFTNIVTYDRRMLNLTDRIPRISHFGDDISKPPAERLS